MQNNYRDLFPIFENQPNLAYLDSAATTQMFGSVLEEMEKYYRDYRANVHRGLYTLSVQATEAYERARERVASFLGAADAFEIVFTHGATDAFNQLADMLTEEVNEGEEIVLTQLEHHSNILPWQKYAEKRNVKVRFIPIDPQTYTLDTSALSQYITARTRIVSVSHISNALGTVVDVESIIQRAREVGAWVVLDICQSIGHLTDSIRALNIDVLVFSGHKMYGPTGVGGYWARLDLLNVLKPAQWGGEMVRTVTQTNRTWNDIPHRFEAGTPPIAEVIGLGKAIETLESIESVSLLEHERNITGQLIHMLQEESYVTPLIPPESSHYGVVSFLIQGVHPHDVAEIADRYNVAIRAGHHCTLPLMQALGLTATSRASIGMYTQMQDIKQLQKVIGHVKDIFHA